MKYPAAAWIVLGLLGAGPLAAQPGSPAVQPGITQPQPPAADPAESCYREALERDRDASRCDLAVRVALDAGDRAAAAAAHANRALILAQNGQLELARQDVLAALELTPDDPDLLALQGTQLLRLGRTREAAASFDRAVSLRPDDPVAHYNRAFALRALGESEAAAAAVARAAALQGGSGATLRRIDTRAARGGRAP